jgi:hypothetical protein
MEQPGFLVKQDAENSFWATDGHRSKLSVLTGLDLKALSLRKADGRNRNGVTIVAAISAARPWVCGAAALSVAESPLAAGRSRLTRRHLPPLTPVRN